MANRSDRDPPNLNLVLSVELGRQMRCGSADSIRASRTKPCTNRPDIKLQPARQTCQIGLAIGRRSYKQNLLIHEAQQGCRDATYEPSRFPVAVPYPSPHRATPAYVVVTSSDLDTSRNKASVSGLSWISRKQNETYSDGCRRCDRLCLSRKVSLPFRARRPSPGSSRSFVSAGMAVARNRAPALVMFSRRRRGRSRTRQPVPAVGRRDRRDVVIR